MEYPIIVWQTGGGEGAPNKKTEKTTANHLSIFPPPHDIKLNRTLLWETWHKKEYLKHHHLSLGLKFNLNK